MLAVIQTVTDASVKVGDQVVGQIENGMLVYFSVKQDDDITMLPAFLDKMLKMRIFKDENDKINLSLDKTDGQILFVSQFTIYADIYSGNRPSFSSSAPGEVAKDFYLKAIEYLKAKGCSVSTGAFGEYMQVEYTNDGPGTYILDSDKLKKK